MAKETKQLVVNVKPQAPSGAVKSFGQQLASIVSKELTPAITKAITEGFAQARGPVRQAAQKVAKEAASAWSAEDEKNSRRRQRFERDVASVRKQHAKAEARSEAQIRDAGEARRKDFGRAVQQVQRAGPAVQKQQMEDAWASRAQEQQRQKDRDMQRGFAVAERTRQRAEPKDVSRATDREVEANANEQARAMRRESGAREKEQKTKSRQIQQDARRVQGAERAIARLEGREDPYLGEVDAASERLGGRAGLGGQLRRARRLGGLFPGAARIARGTGLPIGMVRGGMAMAPMMGGVLSGNVFAGAGGGFASGGLTGALGGMGGLGMAGLGLLGGGAGLLGANLIGGIRSSMAQVPQEVEFARNLRPLMRMTAPSAQGGARDIEAELRQTARGGSYMGLSPGESLDIMSQTARGRGGFIDSGMLAAQNESMSLFAAMGLDPSAVGQVERARRRGGLAGAGQMGAFGARPTTGLMRGAIGLGFQGEEANEFVMQQAGLMTQARSQGTFFNPTTFGATVGALTPGIGQAGAARVAGGLQGALQGVATQGVAGAPNPALGLMMLQSFGGLNLGQKGGLGAADLLRAQEQIEKEGVTPEGMQRMFGFVGQAAGGSTSLKTMMTQRVMGMLGAPQGVGMTRSMLAGQPTGAMAGDIAATITGADQAQRDLAAFDASGPIQRARGIVPTTALGAAEIEDTKLQAAERAAPGAQALERAQADLSLATGNFASALSDLAAKMQNIVNNLVMP